MNFYTCSYMSCRVVSAALDSQSMWSKLIIKQQHRMNSNECFLYFQLVCTCVMCMLYGVSCRFIFEWLIKYLWAHCFRNSRFNRLILLCVPPSSLLFFISFFYFCCVFFHETAFNRCWHNTTLLFCYSSERRKKKESASWKDETNKAAILVNVKYSLEFFCFFFGSNEFL